MSAEIPQIKITEPPSRECLTRFCSGEPDIDSWITRKAWKLHDKNLTKVFCAFLGNSTHAAGLYSLSLLPLRADILFERHADRYKDGRAPFIYIEWLAVQRPHQRRGLGTHLLMDAIRRSYRVSRDVPIYGMALRPLNTGVREKYERFGFVAREDEPHPAMILPIWLINDLVAGSRPAG